MPAIHPPSERAVPRRSRRLAVVSAAVLVAVAGATAVAVDFDSGANVTRTAARVDAGLDDVAVVFDLQEVDRFVVEATFRAAEQAGAAAASGRTASAGLSRVTRAGAAVHAPPEGYLIPMSILALPADAVAGVIGHEVPPMLDARMVVINELTAQQMNAQVGDTLELRALDGSAQGFSISAIVPYAQVGGSDLLIAPDAAARLGLVEDTRMVVWNIPSRTAFEAAVQQQGLVGRADTKVALSWDLRDPDASLSTPRLKAMLGEPWYRIVSPDSISMHPTWMANNLTDGRVLMSSAIPIRARCHVAIVNALGAALAEIAAAGLGGHIDVGNTNTYGGCFNPRYSRTSGFLSRHAYAVAIDINTTSNCQGCVPRMNCDVVRAFRKHGFAWGGNWRHPDGMHFEWVGEPRHQVAYPSTYCPNSVATAAEAAGDGALGRVGRDVLMTGFDEAGTEHD